MDPEEQRAEARERWEAAASAWAHADDFDRAAEPISRAMIEAVQLRPGQVVLELAAGRGTTGFMAAPLIAPAGTLICTDGAEAMVKAAQERGKELGIDETEFKQMELEWLDRDTASVDAILCRFGYMLAVDPEAALREARRVLRPGGRIALAVWDLPERNPCLSVPAKETGTPLDEGPGPFSLSADGAVDELMGAAGFQEIEVSPVEISFEASSLDEVWDSIVGLSSMVRQRLKALSPAEHFALRDRVDEQWSAHVRDDGTVSVPGRALVASASA